MVVIIYIWCAPELTPNELIDSLITLVSCTKMSSKFTTTATPPKLFGSIVGGHFHWQFGSTDGDTCSKWSWAQHLNGLITLISNQYDCHKIFICHWPLREFPLLFTVQLLNMKTRAKYQVKYWMFSLLSFCRQHCRVQRRENSNLCGPSSTYVANWSASPSSDEFEITPTRAALCVFVIGCLRIDGWEPWLSE